MAAMLTIFAAVDLGDIMAFVIVIGSFVVWLVNQLSKANQEQGAPTGPPHRTLAEHQADWQADEDEWDDAEGVSEHVREHIDTHEFDDRSGGMGQLSHLDDTVDEHVHEAFDHQIGSLASETAGGEQAAEPTAAAGVAAVLADPNQLRQAIVLQEILRRREWD